MSLPRSHHQPYEGDLRGVIDHGREPHPVSSIRRRETSKPSSTAARRPRSAAGRPAHYPREPQASSSIRPICALVGSFTPSSPREICAAAAGGVKIHAVTVMGGEICDGALDC
ncbi:hypothetical protein PR202_gb12755 [Eleusine coracana subsp. coracana]|uniref:Uncharacterized protein n=1 Tax=Eleusine coracana subsp. coracana TaxID=191504 RepID=A0AAV5ESC3_ELECO|nr:hypothetical protein PR202_gb12755 [Eleusine coracana subsp. coracana]